MVILSQFAFSADANWCTRCRWWFCGSFILRFWLSSNHQRRRWMDVVGFFSIKANIASGSGSLSFFVSGWHHHHRGVGGGGCGDYYLMTTSITITAVLRYAVVELCCHRLQNQIRLGREWLARCDWDGPGRRIERARYAERRGSVRPNLWNSRIHVSEKMELASVKKWFFWIAPPDSWIREMIVSDLCISFASSIIHCTSIILRRNTRTKYGNTVKFATTTYIINKKCLTYYQAPPPMPSAPAADHCQYCLPTTIGRAVAGGGNICGREQWHGWRRARPLLHNVPIWSR